MSTNDPKDTPAPADAISRRAFVANTAKTAALAAMAPMIVPRHVLGRGYRAPSDRLNIASVGIGGMGMENMQALVNAGENIVAICDVDYGYVERSLAGRLRPSANGAPPSEQHVKLRDAYMKARKHEDFREMLDKQREIDAVVVATPDHLHAVIAMAAMQAGKHVYVQKPLTYSVHEARELARTAREKKVVTQMGNQGHSREGTRRIVEWVNAGVIGPVREAHIWTDRPLRYWAQGIPRPVPGWTPPPPRPAPPAPVGMQEPPPAPPGWNMRTVDNAVLAEMAREPQTPPPGLRWDLFLGPAGDIPYHPAYHPFSWRGWVDFGVSAIGDMGAHLIDQAYWALDLGHPTSIVSASTPWGGGREHPASYPLAMTTTYEFPARGDRPPVKLHWYDGGLMPTFDFDVPMPGGDGGGGVLLGEKGFITYETYGDNPKVFPEALAPAAEAVPRTLPRITVSHEENWAQACRGQGTASSPFEYAARLTEVMLLGIVALRAGESKRIQYDGSRMAVTNVPEANQYLTRVYRSGWQV